MVLSLFSPLALDSLFSLLSACFPRAMIQKAVFSQVMWSTFVCSNLTKECLAFTRLCLRRAVKENKKKKKVGEGGRERRKAKATE